MAKNSIDAYGASGKSNVLFFEPESLHLVTSINGAMLLSMKRSGSKRLSVNVASP